MEVTKVFSKEDTLSVKGIGIIFMLFHHLFGCQRPLEAVDEVVSIVPFSLYGFQLAGAATKLCVALFVFVSAFAITIQYNSLENSGGGQSTFCFKRIKKVFVGYIFIYVFAIVSSGFRTDNIWDMYFAEGRILGIRNMFFDAIGVSSYFGTPTINPTWWYTGFAYFIFCFVPCLVLLYKKIGCGVLVLFVFSGYLGISGSAGIEYMLTMALAVCVAETNLMTRIYEWRIGYLSQKLSSIIKVFICIGLFCILLPVWLTYPIYINAVLSMVVSIMMMHLNSLTDIGFLQILGKHSMNIYLLHTLIYYYCLPKFIYSFKNWFFVLLILILLSLFLSMIIEKGKDILKQFFVSIKMLVRT